MIRLTQPTLRVRSHRHIPPHTIVALERQLPVLFLIRPPLDCVASYAIMCGTSGWPQLPFYVEYHRPLLPYVDRLFIADFSLVTQTPKAVLAAFSRYSGIPLDLGYDSTQCQQEVFARIERENTLECGQVNERTVNRPSAQRVAEKADVLTTLRSKKHRRWLEAALGMYAEFRARAINP